MTMKQTNSMRQWQKRNHRRATGLCSVMRDIKW